MADVGAPTKYKEEYNESVYKLCLLGVTDKELADFYGVCEATINNWKIDYPVFLESITRGKIQADANVAEKLYDRAMGATFFTEQAFKVKVGKDLEEVQVIRLQQTVPPDTPAASLWLRNRRSGSWAEKTVQENTGVPQVVVTKNYNTPK